MKIAVYTIALNEEQFVERWYETAKDADYLLIADTGSTDATVEKARALGINVFPISIKPWRFEDARNASLALLPADIDLCISLDMDETLSDGWREALEKSTGTQMSYKFVWSWKDLAETIPLFTYIHTKVHARHGYRWRGIVHEMPFPDRIKHVEEFLDDFEIHHHPDSEKSRGHYADLLLAGLNEEPDNNRYILYYARELAYRKEYKEAAKHFKNYIKSKNVKHPGEQSLAYRQLAICEPRNAEKYLFKANEADPTRREPLVSLSVYYYKKENWEKCFEYATKALEITRKRLDYVSSDYAWGYLPYNLLAVSRNNMNNDEKWLLKVDSLIATEFNLFGEAPTIEKEEQVLFDVK